MLRNSTTNLSWQRGQGILFRIGNEAQAALRHQRAHILPEHQQLVQEGDAQGYFIWHPVDYEQRTCKWQLEEVVRDRDLVREESIHFRQMCERSEISARLRVTKGVQTLSPKLEAARDTSEYPKKQQPSDIQRSREPLPGQTIHFEDNEAVSHVNCGWSTHRVNMDWLFERVNMDNSISSRDVRIAEQLVDMLAQGAFTTNHWKSLVRFFDGHPPPKFVSRAAFQNHLFPQSLRSFSKPCRTPTAPSATSRADPGTKRRNNYDTELQSNAPHEEIKCALRNKKTRTPTVFGKTCAKRHARTRYLELPRRSNNRASPKRNVENSESNRNYDPTFVQRVAEKISMRESVEFNIPDVCSVHLKHPRRQSGYYHRRGKPCAPRSKCRCTPKGAW